jgi:CRISPR/Cas system-associated protein Cas5 (RAMP superfamily)
MKFSEYNKKYSLYTLLIGTVISIIISLSNQFETPYQYIITLLAEILVLLITIYLKTYEDKFELIDYMIDKDIFLRAKRYSYNIKDKNFYLKFNNLKEELRQLSNGNYSLHDLASVYNDDIISIKSLGENEKLYSMCPVGKNINSQFSNKSFLASIKEHINASKRGVISQRIYIFEKESAYHTDVCKKHLNILIKNNIKVNIIFLDNHDFKDALKLPRDFILFDNIKVSVGILNNGNFVDGANISSNTIDLNKYYNQYEQLLAQSETYTI